MILFGTMGWTTQASVGMIKRLIYFVRPKKDETKVGAKGQVKT